MEIEIINKEIKDRGVIYTVKVNDKIINILYLFHSIERIKKWGITDKMLAETLIFPEEVFIGHRNRYIAHRRYNNHVVRAIYEYGEDNIPILVTVYFPYVERYFKGGGIFEDKILR